MQYGILRLNKKSLYEILKPSPGKIANDIKNEFQLISIKK
jgi:hypothetical protein